jgi:hypothetical protein
MRDLMIALIVAAALAIALALGVGFLLGEQRPGGATAPLPLYTFCHFSIEPVTKEEGVCIGVSSQDFSLFSCLGHHPHWQTPWN